MYFLFLFFFFFQAEDGIRDYKVTGVQTCALPISADAARVPGGAALAVDRAAFAQGVHDRVTRHPHITVVRQEATELPSPGIVATGPLTSDALAARSEEHTSELQSPCNLVCRLLLEKKKKHSMTTEHH